ncbi:hypothetical protein [Limnobacter sp. CACIAM 66H1]|jgi:hypothetical protein|uniref:hypothetical protein n=1 Tax=Limnobacter sp. CACIAM 66H1 TaxID=1813033 RepID=UPI0025C318CE|nr:hypothetical protein [Limnobacter sp. CACIAM 66H1]
MKAAKTLNESLSAMQEVKTNGDLRRIVGNSLLALARKEISHADVEAMAKGLDSISNSLNAEIRIAKTKIELREQGAALGKISHMGQMLIGNAVESDEG